MVYSPVNPWTFPVNPNFPWTPDSIAITAITNANPAVVTTASNHGFSSGFNVRVFYPYTTSNVFGMPQINGLQGTIAVLSPTTFSISIDTTKFDMFSIGATTEKPQAIPISQYVNVDLLDFQQTNPPNPNTLAQVVVFQSPGLQAPGACNTSQT
jgi:hypothetical protein